MTTERKDDLDRVRKFAALTRGEIGTGDRIYNADSFAFRIGFSDDDALELVRNLGISEKQFSLLTGLPPSSLRRMVREIKSGIKAAKYMVLP